MIILAIDPGTSCGWALRYAEGSMDGGTWNLAARRHEGAGMRWVRLRNHLREVFNGISRPGLVAYEEVRRHLGTDAAHVYGGIVAVIQQECEASGIPYCGIPVGTVKKHATGKGNADKVAMVTAAVKQWPSAIISGPDEADARWIAETASKEFRHAA